MLMISDANNNYYPAIYTRNTSNSSTHIEQVIQIVQESQRFGFNVPISAHLKKCLYDISEYYQYYIENRIMSLLDYRATLPGDEDTSIVFVYDIEEITMMSSQHFTELLDLIPETDLSIMYFFVDDILEHLGFNNRNILRGHVSTIDDVFSGETDFVRAGVPAYKALEKFYNEISKSTFDRKESAINNDIFKKCEMIDDERNQKVLQCAVEFQKFYHQRWKYAEKCLKLVKKRSGKSNQKYENVALVGHSLARGILELLVSGNSSYFDIENVYSWQNQTKESVIERIQKRFGDKCTLIYITSSTDITTIHEQMNIPVWTVQARESIELLYKAQRDYLLQ